MGSGGYACYYEYYICALEPKYAWMLACMHAYLQECMHTTFLHALPIHQPNLVRYEILRYHWNQRSMPVMSNPIM